MLKEEEYRKAVCEKTARTVWWGGGGNPTALLYQRWKIDGVESPVYKPFVGFCIWK